LAKILAVFAQTTASFFAKNVIITFVFEKNANFFTENWQKSQKIVTITSTLGAVKVEASVLITASNLLEMRHFTGQLRP
jgi:hypothetical protein